MIEIISFQLLCDFQKTLPYKTMTFLTSFKLKTFLNKLQTDDPTDTPTDYYLYESSASQQN